MPLLVLAAWWWVTKRELVPVQLLLPPWDVATTIRDMLSDGELTAASIATLGRVLAGVAIGATLGLTVGILLGTVRPAARYLSPPFLAIAQVPAIAWTPLGMSALGIGEEFRIAVIALTAFFPIAISAAEAVGGVPKAYREVATVLLLSRRAVIRWLYLPATLPQIVSGLRIGCAKAWMVVVFAELFSASVGLGHLMDLGRLQFQMDVVLAAVLATAILGFLTDRLLRLLQRRLSWSVRTS
jgi:sulfonate transport system permease protein